MPRRLNYTGRKKIPRWRFDLTLRDRDGGFALDYNSLNLAGMGLPGSATVLVEAYKDAAYMRIGAGTVANLDLPTEWALSEFESVVPLFRTKVVGVDQEQGKLLAVADKIRARTEGDVDSEESLLRLVPYDLGNQIWRLECVDDDPRLLINKSVGDWLRFAASPMFESLVVPEALRQIVCWLLDDLENVEEDDDSPQALWVGFLQGLGHDPLTATLDDESDRAIYVNDVVDHFCNRHKLLRQAVTARGEEQ